MLAIECKDVQYRKTYSEIAEQLADFRGGTRSNGKDDYLRKHLVRMGLIRTDLDAVSKFTGVKPLSNVESTSCSATRCRWGLHFEKWWRK
ncbi:hypothetical protein FG91_00459 [Sphingopyxis sp. LC81]|uniref:hypothetical protein n=1 Tax=Sphingopyxis sp. LC81 TaxID=1502850 RepID=UPI00050F17E8|nr:hypothetical protein [Sphingopyxis sp. LC81]KGB56669.1 hypothetical protein FG91_00459 [Sphingopyxis sp. LC81]